MVEAETEQEKEDQQLLLPHGDEHVLLVDDEPLLVEIMKRFLSLQGYEVTSFVDSRQALEWFTRHPDQVDLVITDMTMPHLTGANLAQAILATRPEMPIILCTGYSEVMDADRASALGIQKFLLKPVDNRVLAQSVREVLET